MPSVAFLTLGCKLNFSESSSMARAFESKGFTRMSPGRDADVFVVNTCSVTAHADKKDRQAIRHLISRHPNSIMIITGCYAQLDPDGCLAIDGVDLVVGAQSKEEIASLAYDAFLKGKHNFQPKACVSKVYDIQTMFPAYSCGDRTRSFLKVQDGCDYHCSYCTVPKARGNSRNIPIVDIVRQASEIASMGMKEIVITGVNIGDFGRSTGESFFELIQALEKVDGIERYRISSIEPNLLKPEIIRWIGSHHKFVPHFHIPLQSGSDAVLKAMRRRYNTALFEERINLIREYIPDAFIGIDVIAGFPGETEEDFLAEYSLLERLKPAFLHVFPYSMRPDTPAVDEIPASLRVADTIRDNRAHRLGLLSQDLLRSFYRSQVGKTWDVLYESRVINGMMQGYTPNYIRVLRKFDPDCVGGIFPVTIQDSDVEAL